MRNLLVRVWPQRRTWWRIVCLLGVVGVPVGAFCWGRYVASSQAASPPGAVLPPTFNQNNPRRAVAYLYERIPISREELGEYLIDRFGAERLEYLINRKIIDYACKAKGIYVTDSEVQAQMQNDLDAFGKITEKQFADQILKRFNKTLFEWKEDVIRPKLMLAKLCRAKVRVTPEDIQKRYEALYGPKVQCRMLVLSPDKHLAFKVHEEVSKDKKVFLEYAQTKQFIPQLAAKGGEVPPIHKHFPEPKLEQAAFNLSEGQISQVLEMPEDHTHVILLCEKHIPANTAEKLDSKMNLALFSEIQELKLAQEIQRTFQELRKEANPQNLLKNQLSQETLERNVTKELNAFPGITGPPGR